ncbi:MAG: hypothetical protein IAI49_03525 [Candidatus Eremiobacteraeota bacterium]|nr:hypothetical protein [Candidatus Eremiobacteraeota bacterium]
MDIIPNDLGAAAGAARERLAGFARSAAVANAGPNRGPSTSPGGAMAGAAREAIFADALLAAMHARLEELKGVAR